jgi:hypothetical protein
VGVDRLPGPHGGMDAALRHGGRGGADDRRDTLAGGAPSRGLGGQAKGMYGHYGVNACWSNTAVDNDDLRGLGPSGRECPATWDVHAGTIKAHYTA